MTNNLESPAAAVNENREPAQSQQPMPGAVASQQ
jgi:hypothetical protein